MTFIIQLPDKHLVEMAESHHALGLYLVIRNR